MRRDAHGPQFSIIIPVYNGARTLGACLAALERQDVANARHEIIVVDDGSTDESVAVAAGYDVKLLRQAHAGAAAARNHGASQARGDILVFTDADCEPAAGWLQALTAPFADPQVCGARGVYRTRQASLVARFSQAEYEEKYSRLARQERIDFVDTYSAAYRHEVFASHGGFDARFLLDEDQEFSFRLAAAGHRLVFVPDAIVYHHHPATLWHYLVRKVRLGRWKVHVHLRHPARAVRDSYTPWTQKVQILIVPIALLITAAAWLRREHGLEAAIAWLLAVGSTVPLATHAIRQGWHVALATPGLALARAAALGAGLVWGALDLVGRWGR